MPGTYVKDTLAPRLANAQSVATSAVGNTAGKADDGSNLTNGIHNVKWPHEAMLEVEVTTAIAAGSVAVELQSSPSPTFANNIVGCGTVGPIDATAGTVGSVFRAQVYVPHRYVRAYVHRIGTATGAVTAHLRNDKYRREKATTGGGAYS